MCLFLITIILSESAKKFPQRHKLDKKIWFLFFLWCYPSSFYTLIFLLTYWCPELSIRCVIWVYKTAKIAWINEGINHKVTKYLEERCLLNSDWHFSFQHFSKDAFVKVLKRYQSAKPRPFWPLKMWLVHLKTHGLSEHERVQQTGCVHLAILHTHHSLLAGY